MKLVKVLVAIVALVAIGASAQDAPLLNRPEPASSKTGARAIDNFIRPALPGNICTSDNNKCITLATLPGYVAPLIPPPPPAQSGSWCGLATVSYTTSPFVYGTFANNAPCQGQGILYSAGGGSCPWGYQLTPLAYRSYSVGGDVINDVPYASSYTCLKT